MPRLLAVLPDHPHPLDMGSRVRNVRILESLAPRFELRIVTLVHDPAHLDDPGTVATLGDWVPVLAPHRRNRAARLGWHVRARWSLMTEGLHPETFFQSFPALARETERQLERFRPHIVHAAYWYGLRCLASRPRPPLWVVDTHDVQFERQERLWGRRSAREKALELRELRRYDHVVAITAHDRDVFARELGPSPPVEVLPMGLDLEIWSPRSVVPAAPPAPRVVFYGNLTNANNQEAARHLMRDILPPLLAELPELEATLLGAGPPAELVEQAARAPFPTRVTGFVEDVRPELRAARVFALALESGSGQRGRVVESLALGVPVVGYAGGLEGLDLGPGEGIVIVETPAAFRAELSRLLRDPATAAELGERGRLAVADRYGLAATYGRFPSLYEGWLRA